MTFQVLELIPLVSGLPWVLVIWLVVVNRRLNRELDSLSSRLDDLESQSARALCVADAVCESLKRIVASTGLGKA
jgi:hypothetical protein